MWSRSRDVQIVDVATRRRRLVSPTTHSCLKICRRPRPVASRESPTPRTTRRRRHRTTVTLTTTTSRSLTAGRLLSSLCRRQTPVAGRLQLEATMPTATALRRVWSSSVPHRRASSTITHNLCPTSVTLYCNHPRRLHPRNWHQLNQLLDIEFSIYTIARYIYRLCVFTHADCFFCFYRHFDNELYAYTCLLCNKFVVLLYW